MASSWVIKSRQMGEAGKEILLREALATHMRSTRDRQMVTYELVDPRPLEDIYSFFAAFWLYHYQGVRLLSFDEAQELTIERKDEMTREERRQLELEIRQLLGEKPREEIDIVRLVSEFVIHLSEEIGSPDPTDSSTIEKCVELIKDHLAKIPADYSPNQDIDFINRITGWATQWRDELYSKASGLKESSLSLRDELLREHPTDVIETTVLRYGIKEILGTDEFASGRLVKASITDKAWKKIAEAVLKKIQSNRMSPEILIKAHELRISILEEINLEFDSPTTITEYERVVGNAIAGQLGEAIKTSPDDTYDIISVLLDLPSSDIQAALRSKGIRDTSAIADGLISLTEEPEPSGEGPQLSEEEMEDLERTLKRLEKLETTLEKQVKGMLKAQGLRPSELDRISIEFLAKDRQNLIGIEDRVLEALMKKVRVPSPEEMKELLLIRRQVESGSLSSIGMKSATDMIQRRQHGETLEALRMDFVWHSTIELLTNLTRVVETYIRSKQDLLRTKALLKSIYEDTEPELQFLREEILIDLASMRIYELKCVHPELDAATICAWMHARLSNQDMSAAKDELENTSSPVFAGIKDTSLKLDGLEFDNYAIAYDLMHRFLARERIEKVAKEEYALEIELSRKKAIEGRRAKIDVLSWLDTKCKTVFRAISRVGARGLEWNQNDEMKCANLLSFYIKQHRGRFICTVCGSTPSEGKCKSHGKGNVVTGHDYENLIVFVMNAITIMKTSLVGSKADPMTWSEARKNVDRVISELKRRGKITSKTKIKKLLPGEINQIIGPAIAKVIGKYFNESVEYAARRADIA